MDGEYGDTEEPYCYIYIFNRNNPGGKGTRKIVAATCIKKFNYEAYMQDHEKYKDKVFKLKEALPGEELCHVLYAGGTYDLVKTYITTSQKRFHIPNLDLSNVSCAKGRENNDDDEIDDETVKEVQNKKKTRKKQKVDHKKSDNERTGSIINNYLKNHQEVVVPFLPQGSVSDPENSSTEHTTFLHDNMVPNQHSERRDPLQDVSNSTPKKTATSTSTENDEAACNAYKMQMLYYKQKYEESKSKAEGLQRIMPSVEPHKSKGTLDVVYEASHQATYPQSDADVLAVKEQTESFVILNRGIKCNSLAYKDAFKTNRFQTFFTTMNQGIYGVEDLATRQVKTTTGSTKRPLSPHKREVVEDEFYKFLTVHQYPLHIITQQMDKKQLNSYHHNSISAAKKKVKRSR